LKKKIEEKIVSMFFLEVAKTKEKFFLPQLLKNVIKA
jgi:hypothetical protein